MNPSFLSSSMLQKLWILFHVFAMLCAESNSDPPSCEVTYMGKDKYENDAIYCEKTHGSLSDLNRTHLVMKYACNDREPVHHYVSSRSYYSIEFNAINCTLSLEIFNICIYIRYVQFTSRTGNSNPVLRNNTFNNKFDFTKIHLERNGIKSIESGAFGCHRSLWWLDLSDNFVESLPVDVFKCMPKLGALFLENNRISELSHGIFDGLHSLYRISMSSNLITHLPDEIFSETTKLEVLYLDSNKLETFCPFAFSGLKILFSLSIANSSLQNLTDSCFLQQNKLQVLDIGMNAGLLLSNDSFVGLDYLYHLLMDSCEFKLTSAVSGLFSHTPRLGVLRMQHNHLQEVIPEVFKPLIYLTHLNLSFNDIAILRGSPFRNNIMLEHLDLSGNNLREINSDDFRGLSSLKRLILSHNPILTVASDSFLDLQNLSYLDISSNNMSPVLGYYALQEFLPNLPKLETLDVNNSNLAEFRIDSTRSNRSFVLILDIRSNVENFVAANLYYFFILLSIYFIL